jgi:hypothetical protein
MMSISSYTKMANNRAYMHLKILCTMKSTKQQISYFSCLLLSTRAMYKNYQAYILHILFTTNFTKSKHLFHLIHRSNFFHSKGMWYIFHSIYMTSQDQQNKNHIFLTFLELLMHIPRIQAFNNLNKALYKSITKITSYIFNMQICSIQA